MTDAIGWAGLAALVLSLVYSVRVARMLNGYSRGLWAFPLAFALALLRRVLAMASMHRVEFLLTWNINHLANANKTRHLSVLNARLGLPVPIITTPITLLPEVMP